MRVFVTGATGFVGSAVVQELLRAGHSVVGLARSEASAQALKEAGAEVQLGSLDDLDSLRSGASSADGVIHCAFVHDFSNFEESCAKDRRAIEAFGEVLAGSDRPLVVTSGIALVKADHLITEEDAAEATGAAAHRAASEVLTLELASKGVRAMLLRLPPSVHGKGDHGLVPMLIGVAREKGVSAYLGDGANRWPTVHRFDAARLYRLALEKGTAGTRYQAIGDEGVPTREIAEAIGRGLGLPIVAKPKEEAASHFSPWLGGLFGHDVPASSALTREWLGWEPKEGGLLADMEESYFKS